jgi:hypothetical protein
VATSVSVFLLICLIILSTGTPVAERTTTTTSTSTEEPLSASQKAAMRQRGLSCEGTKSFTAPYYVETLKSLTSTI